MVISFCSATLINSYTEDQLKRIKMKSVTKTQAYFREIRSVCSGLKFKSVL